MSSNVSSGASSVDLVNQESLQVRRAMFAASIQSGNMLIRQESVLSIVERDTVALPPVQEHKKSPSGCKLWRLLSCKTADVDIGKRMKTSTADVDIGKKMKTSFTRRVDKNSRRGSFFHHLLKATSLGHFGHTGLEVSDFSRMQRLVMEMKDGISALENTIPPNQELEKWACVVYESMSASSRTFHGVQHVFDISVEADEVQKLSAYFHDCIYYTIDGGLSERQAQILDGIIVEEGDDIYVTESDLEENMQLVTDIFGFTKGQKLNPFKGLNEYLSAALAIRCFASFLSPRYLAQIAACIEATIPFRAGDPMGDLHYRLKRVNVTYNLKLKSDEIMFAVVRAADFANRDLSNFSLDNKAVFLSNTWNLLPESNISLRHTQVFQISDFAMALKKMTGFFTTLQAETIFCSYNNKPEDNILNELTQKAKENIEVALVYMHCKQLSTAVLSALAALTGGDAPVAMFLGDLPDGSHISPSIEDLITIKKKRKGVILDSRVFALLRDGRESESEFDIKKSPCAAFLYANIGDEGVQEALKHIVYPMDKEHAKALLRSLPKPCVTEIGLACASIAITRSAALKVLIHQIQHDSDI
jgi:hypothetical protein